MKLIYAPIKFLIPTHNKIFNLQDFSPLQVSKIKFKTGGNYYKIKRLLKLRATLTREFVRK